MASRASMKLLRLSQGMSTAMKRQLHKTKAAPRALAQAQQQIDDEEMDFPTPHAELQAAIEQGLLHEIIDNGVAANHRVPDTPESASMPTTEWVQNKAEIEAALLQDILLTGELANQTTTLKPVNVHQTSSFQAVEWVKDKAEVEAALFHDIVLTGEQANQSPVIGQDDIVLADSYVLHKESTLEDALFESIVTQGKQANAARVQKLSAEFVGLNQKIAASVDATVNQNGSLIEQGLLQDIVEQGVRANSSYMLQNDSTLEDALFEDIVAQGEYANVAQGQLLSSEFSGLKQKMVAVFDNVLSQSGNVIEQGLLQDITEQGIKANSQ